MRDENHASGLMAMLVERFEGQHLDRLLDLKSAVDSGELLGDHNSAFLAKVCEEAKKSKQLVDRHPEYQPLYARAVRLYKEIAERALENEIRASPTLESSPAAN
jgi:hypothetical protein